MNLTLVKETVTRAIGRGTLLGKKYSPEILLVAGIGGLFVSGIMIAKGHQKASDWIDAFNCEKYSLQKDASDMPEEWCRRRKKEIVVTCAKEVTKAYAPGVSLAVLSTTCILGSHGIMKKRNIALAAAYKTMEQTFSDYRKRLIEDVGEDADRKYYYGIETEEVTEDAVDENGKKKKVKKTVETIKNPGEHSIYARYFDEGSTQWSKTPEYNLLFLKNTQNYMNDLLHSRGHVFLNEVYDALGLEHSQAGAVVGWIMGEGRDNCIDFGIFNQDEPRVRAFVNGYENVILLDFNVDGVIYDLI